MNQKLLDKLMPAAWRSPNPGNGDMWAYRDADDQFENLRGELVGEPLYTADALSELIVKTCITQIALIGISNFENDDISWTVSKAIEMIKEHFGVK